MESDVVEAVAKHIPLEYTDVTAAFASCESRMVTDGLTEGYTMLALPLKGFAGKMVRKS